MLTDRVQLARFDINAEALANMAIAILPFPHQPLVQQFVEELAQHKKKNLLSKPATQQCAASLHKFPDAWF